MIAKMKFVDLTGPREDIDRVIDRYLSRHDVQLVSAFSELQGIRGIKHYTQDDSYKNVYGHAVELMNLVQGYNAERLEEYEEEEAAKEISRIMTKLDNLRLQQEKCEKDIERCKSLLEQIEPFQSIDYDLNTILDFKFVKYRFGKINKKHFSELTKQLEDNKESIFYECDSDQQYVWALYFVPEEMSTKVDAIYASLQFERIYIPAEYEGTPKHAYKEIMAKISELEVKMKGIGEFIRTFLKEEEQIIIDAYYVMDASHRNHNIYKYAACFESKGEELYTLCGWMTEQDSTSLILEIEEDDKIFSIVEWEPDSDPPVRLRNKFPFKFFETFIDMYGLPSYGEIDPTKFVAITYAIMFGIMYGDVGQGLVLVFGGALLYRWKRIDLAAILSICGVFSTIFGFVYGSLFGFEDTVLKSYVEPMHNVMGVLMATVAFGIGLIFVAMLMNIFNAVKAKEYGKVLFGQNGVAGLMLYGTAVASGVSVFLGNGMPSTPLLVILIGIPLLAIFFKEPLTKMVEKEEDVWPEQKVMFFVESFFELFEIVLSYITNTISFVRVGAFALSHAGMMSVVLLLGNAASDSPNYIVIIIGNLIVMGVEGLIVSIQVLRLEFYEMFSRFYTGEGKAFRPFDSSKEN